MCESFYVVVAIQILNRANLFFHMFHVKHSYYYPLSSLPPVQILSLNHSSLVTGF